MEQEPIINAHNKDENKPMHTAEHILNQTMVRMFACPRSKNAHIERKKSKCDYLLPKAPSAEQIGEIEKKVNEVISNNLPITIEYLNKEEAAKVVDLSKLPEEASDTLRIVKVGEYDTCACAGNHVSNTKEIGQFTIISSNFEDKNNEELGRWRVSWKVM